MANARITRGVTEENAMAILDSSGVKDTRDILEDKLSFLEAVRASALLSGSAAAPTWKMYDAIFQIFDDREASLELVVACHRLLAELNKRYSRVSFADADRGGGFVVVEAAWSPFVVGSENAKSEGEGTSRKGRFLIDSAKFYHVVHEIAEAVNDMGCQPNMKIVRKMILVQYLYSMLEADFLPRQSAYKEMMNWALVRESLLNMLLGSGRLNFKSFVRDCLLIINKSCQTSKGNLLYESKNADVCDAALVFSLGEIERATCLAIHKLLALIMEFDAIKTEAEKLLLTSRTDAVRMPAIDTLVDELTYDKEHTSSFLLAFSEPKWKLEIVLQYICKYCSKVYFSLLFGQENPANQRMMLH